MKTNELNEKLRAALTEIWKRSPKMVDYDMKSTTAACELSNGMILTTNKQPIEKRFCFGYSDCGQGPDFSEAIRAEQNAKSEEYFVRENLRRFTDRLNLFDDRNVYPVLRLKYYEQNETNPLRELSFVSLSDLLGRMEYDEYKPGATVTDAWGNYNYIPTTDDMKRIRTMYEEAKAAHEKKVRSYLKRYGTTKVRTWTYWLDE